MARQLAISPESFEKILAWLHPNREVAAMMYVQLRHDLAKIFKWKGCHDPEGLTDEVFDRVARKVNDVSPTYEGDPRLYFRAVANNLIKENLKRLKSQIPLDDLNLAQKQETEIQAEKEAMDECLQGCLQELSAENRALILAYYAKEKQAKIGHRSELAQSLGLSVQTLRVKVYRIRASLEQCMERCLKPNG
jgi:RNA polymerase sigma factor (sigma-70 family)